MLLLSKKEPKKYTKSSLIATIKQAKNVRKEEDNL